MRTGTAATDLTGMPRAHARAFQAVANESRCVILSRACGPNVTGLLEDSYATKGFHNKAKSCNWGPMSGFVLSDPQFTKQGMSLGAIGGQAAALRQAFKAGADEMPIYVSERRRQELEARLGLGSPAPGSNINEKRYDARGKRFLLRRALDAPGNDGQQLWAVLYAPGEEKWSSTLQRQTIPDGLAAPVMAMVDPLCPTAVRRTYRGATTGDHDLWAIFPPAAGKASFSRSQDARPVPGSDRFELPISEFIAHEDEHMGNITLRGRAIKEQLNQRIRAFAGYKGGDCVHHSDEAGRPKVSEVDYPAIGFVPGHSGAYSIENRADLLDFIGRILRFQYYVTFNPGWHRELGIRVSPAGSYEV